MILDQICMMSVEEMDFAEIDNIEFDGIDWEDYPDFVDAYIVSADYQGIPLTDDQIEELNEFSEFVYEKLQAKLF